MKLIKDLREFIELLTKHNVQYLIVGGWAINNYLAPRMTGDIDFFLSRTVDNQNKLRAVLEAFGFGDVIPKDRHELLPPEKILMLGRQPHRIDIISQIDGVSFEDAWNSKVSGVLDDLPVYFISPHMLLKNKIAAGRAKDMGDVENLKKLLK